MKGIYNYILQVDFRVREKKEMPSGAEIYIDEFFSQMEAVNRIGKIIGTPSKTESEIKDGAQVLFDPTPLLRAKIKHVRRESEYCIDPQKKWYYLNPGFIIAYKNIGEDDWKGFGKNNLVKPIPANENDLVNTFLHIPENTKPKFKKQRAIAKYLNRDLFESGVEAGDQVVLKDFATAEYELEGVKYWYVRNSDVLAKVV